MTNEKPLNAALVLKNNTTASDKTVHTNTANSNNNDNKGGKNAAPASKSNRAPVKKKSIDEEEDLKSRCSFFHNAIPIMPKSLAIACCIMNILFPGLGTFISSFSIFFCATHKYQTNLKAFLINMLAFVMQLFSAIIIFGWVWSIKYGLLFVHLADKTENLDLEPDLPLFVRRHSSMEATMYIAKPRLSAIALAKVNEDEPI